jgi:hypothetical protein
LRGAEVGEKIAERVKKSCEASAWQGAFRLGEARATLGEALATLGETLALVGKALALQEVARHCRETLGGLRAEGLGMGSLRADGLGVGIKGMGCLGVDGRLGVLGWEGGRESGKVVEGWSGESREGA